MDAFKFAAFLTEFPFLKVILGESRDASAYGSIVIQRVSPELLQLKPSTYEFSGTQTDVTERKTVSFVLNDGTISKGAVKSEGTSESSCGAVRFRRWDGETVLEAIYRHGVADCLEYIVSVDEGYGLPNGSYRAVTVYKPPKGLSYVSLVQQAVEKARLEVLAEADF